MPCSSRSLFSFRLQLHPSYFSINTSTHEPCIFIYLFELKIFDVNVRIHQYLTYLYLQRSVMSIFMLKLHILELFSLDQRSLKLAKFTLPNYTIYIFTFVNQIYVLDYLQYRQVIKISSNTIYSHDKFSSQLRHRAT